MGGWGRERGVVETEPHGESDVEAQRERERERVFDLCC